MLYLPTIFDKQYIVSNKKLWIRYGKELNQILPIARHYEQQKKLIIKIFFQHKLS